MKTHRAAVIGCSRMGGFIDYEIAPGDLAHPLPYSHVARYEACERTDLVACSDLREDVMDQFGRRYDIPKERRHADFRELIDRVCWWHTIMSVTNCSWCAREVGRPCHEC